MKRILVSLALIAVSAAPASASVAIGYSITDLGELFNSGTSWGAKDINESGQVALNLDGNAYVWDNGVLSPAGGLFNNNTSFAINDDADLTWTANLRAQYFDGTTQTELPTLEANSTTTGWDINIHDHIVGTSRRDGRTRAYFWNGVTMMELESVDPAEGARALGINDATVIVGAAGDSAVPVRWVSGVLDELMLAPTFTRGSADDINEAGQIAGTLLDSSASGGMAARWAADGSVTPLGRLTGHGFSSSQAINELGDVVGWSSTSSSGSFGHQAAFFDNGTVYNLNDLITDPGWNLTRAYGINSSGLIVGAGTLDGDDHAFLLSPIPEPGRAMLLMLSAFGVAMRRRR